MNLLIVDDEGALRRAVRRLLERQGVSVIGEAGDGSEAVRLASELGPDTILMDLRMPVLDGIAAIKAIRATGSPVAIILHTAYADPALREEAMAAGADGCIVKGTSPAALKEGLIEISRRSTPDAPS